AQDKQYLIGFAQLPDGATLDRTEDVVRRMDQIAMKTPGVEHAVSFPGLSSNGFTNSSNSGIVFTPLKAFDERKSADLSAGAIAACRSPTRSTRCRSPWAARPRTTSTSAAARTRCGCRRTPPTAHAPRTSGC